MTTVDHSPPSSTGHADDTSFDSLDPATQEVVATFPIDDEVVVRYAVERARLASAWWRSLDYQGRSRHLNAYAGEIARRIDELADLIHRENGKPKADAVLEDHRLEQGALRGVVRG